MIAALLLLLTAPPQEPPPAPSGIVLVLVDDLGWIDLSCQGSEWYETPHIDRLATEGLRFTQAYASAAICSPTRAAVQTGRHPARVGVTDWIRARFQGGALPADGANPSGWLDAEAPRVSCPRNPLWMEHEELTIAELLGDEWTRLYIGKWHLGLDDWYPEHQGFDLNIGGCDFGQPPSYFDPYTTERQGGIYKLAPRREGEYLTDREADECVRFLREHAEERFFLSWSPYAVHTPIQAKEELTEQWRARPDADGHNARYAAMIQSLDEGVGLLLDTLDELGRTDDTLIVFTSDNGGLQGPTDNAPLRAGKGWPYEAGIRVPMLVRWPGVVPANSTSDEVVTSVDLLPTLLEAAGAELPAVELDGLSLLPHARSGGEQTLGREDAPFVWHFPHYRSRQIGPYSVLRLGDWKLLHWWEGARDELYHLGRDPEEAHDLAAAEPVRVLELREALVAELARLGAKLPR